jgi:hypothetical protein
MPPDVAGEVLDNLKWDRGASVVFRKVCKGWRDAHDDRATRLNVTRKPTPFFSVDELNVEDEVCGSKRDGGTISRGSSPL